MLSFDQIEQVAALRNDPGFILLLDALQAQIDTVADELQGADGSKEAQLLGSWRGLRETYAILKNKPEELALRLDQERQARQMGEGVTVNMYNSTQRTTMPPEAIEALRKEYNRRIKNRKV